MCFNGALCTMAENMFTLHLQRLMSSIMASPLAVLHLDRDLTEA